MPSKQVILILGMHRSGTSAVARGVNALGIPFGNRLMAAVPDQNPKGFWEDLDIVDINDRVLISLGRSWHSLGPIEADEWHGQELANLGELARKLLSTRLAQDHMWGFKDPRACRLLPFWQPVFTQLEADDAYVIALRNPVSVAQSLAVRNGFTAEKSYQLWLEHMLPLVMHTEGRRRIFVDYDELLAHPEPQLERISVGLGLTCGDREHQAINEYTSRFLSRSLRHSNYGLEAVRDDPRVSELTARAYELLRGLALDRREMNEDEFIQEWRSLDKGVRAAAPLLRYLDRCEARIEELVRDAHRSDAPSNDGASDTKLSPSRQDSETALRTSQPAQPGRDLGGIQMPIGQEVSAQAENASDARISVVIPLYNHEAFIEKALESVMAQTVRPREIIVVDDGSTDGSVQTMDRLCRQYPEIIFWSHPNQGAHFTLNAAIHRASGDFVSILNSDDVYHPERFEMCLRAMREHPEADAVVTGVYFIDVDGFGLDNPWYAQARAFHQEVGDPVLALANANLVVSTSNLFVRRSVFKDVGYFSPLRYTHDLDFCLRLLGYGKEIFFLDGAFLGYRLHGGNTISEGEARIDVERSAVLAFCLYQFWRGRGKADAWSSYLAQFEKILESQSVTELVAYFLSYLDERPRDEIARLFLAPDSEFLRFVDATQIDWLSSGASEGLAKELIAARCALLRQNNGFKGRGSSAGYRDWIQKLQEAKGWLESQVKALEEGNTWLKDQVHSLEGQLQEHERMLADTRAWNERLMDGNDWLKGQTQALEGQLQERDRILADTREWVKVLTGAKESLESQLSEIQARIHTLEQTRLWRLLHRLRVFPGLHEHGRDDDEKE